MSEGSVMIVNVKAKYSNGVLTPLEPLDIAEGAEVALVIEEIPVQAAPKGANAIGDMSMLARHLIEKYPDDGRDRPTDGSINYKHYMYGHPKKEP